MAGASENIQAKLTDLSSNKEPTITGAATSITSSNLTVSRALTSDTSGKVVVSDVTSTELGYLDGATENIQAKLTDLSNNKEPTITGAATTITSSDLTGSKALISDGSGKVAVSTISTTELGRLSGVSENIQSKLTDLSSNKEPTITGAATSITGSNLTVSRA